VRTLLRTAAVALLLALAPDARAFERRWGLELGLSPGLTGLGFDGGSYAPTMGLRLGLGYMVNDVMEVRASANAAPMRTGRTDAGLGGAAVEGAGWLTFGDLGVRFLARGAESADSPWSTAVGLAIGAGAVPLRGRDGVARASVGFALSFEVGAERELSRDLSLGLALRVAQITVAEDLGVDAAADMGLLVGPVLYVRRSWGF
jgi:hypothetical protein